MDKSGHRHYIYNTEHTEWPEAGLLNPSPVERPGTNQEKRRESSVKLTPTDLPSPLLTTMGETLAFT